MPCEEPPDRTAAAGDPPLVHRRGYLVQRQIRMLRHQFEQPLRMSFQRRRTTPARLRCRASGRHPALNPSDRRTDAYLEKLCRLSSGRAALHLLDHSLPQILRIGLRHVHPPHRSNRYSQTRTTLRPRESPRFNQIETCFSLHAILGDLHHYCAGVSVFGTHSGEQVFEGRGDIGRRQPGRHLRDRARRAFRTSKIGLSPQNPLYSARMLFAPPCRLSASILRVSSWVADERRALVSTIGMPIMPNPSRMARTLWPASLRRA